MTCVIDKMTSYIGTKKYEIVKMNSAPTGCQALSINWTMVRKKCRLRNNFLQFEEKFIVCGRNCSHETEKNLSKTV